MHLFIQGQPGVGKSSLIRKALEPISSIVAGFATQRLIENGKVIGFCAYCVAGTLPSLETIYVANQPGAFILNGKIDISVLEKIILQVEQNIKNPKYEFVLLDEIGGIELKSRVFMGALLRILSSGKHCIGVLKSAHNMSHTVSTLKLDAEYLDMQKDFEQIICTKSELFSVTYENRDVMQDYFCNHVQQLRKL